MAQDKGELNPDILKVSILGSESIHVGFHLIPYFVNQILSLRSSTYVVVTDTNIGQIHLPEVVREFSKQIGEQFHSRPGEAVAPRILYYEVPPGEGSKSRKQKEMIEDWMLENRCLRDTVLIALGGGVVGDLTGYVAATYMRGIKFVAIPTTLLAMVDSAVGGKTAVDTPHGKNFIGAFWQPTFLFVDLSFLETLGSREFSNGMAEVVKTAAIWKDDDFALLESRANEIIAAVGSGSTAAEHTGRFASTRTEPQSLLMTVVTGSIYVKSHIVTIDERETGLRNLVNYGHTIGHAIEAILTPRMLHGECVAIGMILEAEVARQKGVFSQVGVGRLTRALKAYGLPVSLQDPRITSLPVSKKLSVSTLLNLMKVDKKNSGAFIKVVLLSRIGKTYEEKASSVENPIIEKVLSDAVRVRAGIPRAMTEDKQGVVMSTPGSKSISNRALVLAALGTGTCRMRNLLHSDDTAVMMAALSDLKGAKFAWEDGGETLVVEGGGGHLNPPSSGKDVYLGNAGTAARFLTAVCTLVQPEGKRTFTVVTGNARMKQRPIGPLVEALRENGSEIAYLEGSGCLPLNIASKGLKGGHIKLAASVSSQYVSAVLLCAPYAREPVTLELTGGQVISQLYIDMTIAMMQEFGIEVVREKDASGTLLDIYKIGRGSYKNPAIYNVESDASSATYPLAIAAITGTTCTLTNIGTSSLQGDARFAKEVLEPMGCTVVQTANQTTVTGPPVGQLRALHSVDMEPMTDAFLTASVLAAVATAPPLESRFDSKLEPNVTRIYGIANQRVKECNRIQAMRDQLRKFGVQTDEFEDGIIIFGSPLETLKEEVSVHCYDDHRVAMAFSVLATVVDNTVITEKRCVEKTWPNWWDDLTRFIGIDVEGVDLADQGQTSGTSARLCESLRENATIFIIGMRGAGKTYLSTEAGSVLNRPVLDADDFFVEQEGQSISQLVAKEGWPAFREKEREHLAGFIQTKSEGHIISLGGGVVETPACRDLLKNYLAEGGIVVHVFREIDEIRRYLTAIGDTTARPSYGESPMDVFTRRRPWYYDCSSHDYLNYKGSLVGKEESGPSEKSKAEANRFFSLLAGLNSNRPDLSLQHRTSVLALTLPDLTPALSLLEQITVGVDAVELRVDLLSTNGFAPTHETVPPIDFVALQLAALRHQVSLPIVFSVRTKAQGGFFPDQAHDDYFDLVRLAIRSGCEYIDIEVDMPKERVAEVVKHKGASQIIASWHDWTGESKWNGTTVALKYEQCSTFGDIVKLVGTATEVEDNTLLAVFAAHARKTSSKPLIAINMGQQGQMSRILNPVLTSVTHSTLPSPTAPGQTSFARIQQALHLLGRLPAKQYYLFGTPIKASLSPTIHNSGFEALGLPHTYSLHQTEEVDISITRILADPNFGGASVTIPHKLSIMSQLTEVSEDARAIGAVNTITVKQSNTGSRILFGDNSDWKAIRTLASRRMPSNVRISGKTTGLVIGAGGTCRAAVYAIHKLGIHTIYLYNRTKENAEKIAEFFPKTFNIICLTSLEQLPGAKPSVIVSTVPGGSLTLDSNVRGILLKSALLSEDGGVAIEMAYRPKVSALIELAQRHSTWEHVFGYEILLEQAFVQFENWTGRRAPKLVQLTAVQEKEKERDSVQATRAAMNQPTSIHPNGTSTKHNDAMLSYPSAAQIEYSSSAPMPTQSATHTVNGDDPEVPTHLYERLPKSLMVPGVDGKDATPDYVKMILLSKVYSAPLNLQETPLTLAVNLSAKLGNEIWLKREDLQPVFSFKVRGAYNMMAHLTEEERWKGVITCSAGNHAQGVALAGYNLKVPCTIVMPMATPSIKWRNVERLGAKVVLHGQDFDEAKAECARLAKTYGLTFVPPYDDPYVIAGQGSVAVELARQVKDFESLDGIFASIGGGGLVSGMSSYIKRIAPDSVKVMGVETVDGDAMKRSIAAGKRVTLSEVGPFSDGTAVRIVGEECFRICKDTLDDITLVNNDEICAAVKDVFEETRSVPEPAGALALAGLKAHIVRNNLVGARKKFVAVISGANMNFGRLRFVAERAEIGERREVLMSVRIPERPGSFVKLHDIIHPRATTEFSYRYSSDVEAHVITSFLLRSSPSSSTISPEARTKEVNEIFAALAKEGMSPVDLSDDEFAKSHVRHMVGGKKHVLHERLFRFEFPERPGALKKFLSGMASDWSITMFHYRNHGSDVARVLVGVTVPPSASDDWNGFVQQLGYPYVEETNNLAYTQFLKE